MVYSPPGFSVCGIIQARILEWVAIPPSSGSSRSRETPMMLKQTTENILFNCDYTRFILEISSTSEHSIGNYSSCIYVMDWKFWVPKNLISWSLNPQCDDIWRWGPRKKWLRLNEVISIGPWYERISVLIKRDTRQQACSSLPPSLSLSLHTYWGHYMHYMHGCI